MLDPGFWAGHSIYPETKMDEPRMVALVKQYGAERILVNSAADWGVSRPAEGAQDARRDARGRASPTTSLAPGVLGQPGRVLRAERPARPGRGRDARSRSTSASSTRATRCCAVRRRGSTRASHAPHARARRRRADAGPDRRARAGVLDAAREAGARRSLVTVLPAVTCTAQSTFVTGTLPRDHGCVAQRLVLPRPRRGRAVAAGEPAGRRRAVWDAREAPRSGLHLREPVLVVRDVRVGRYRRHAASDVPGRRPQAPRRLDPIRRSCATTLQNAPGHVPAVRLLGPARGACRRAAGSRAPPIESGARSSPTLGLVYLPHLDYVLQRQGPRRARASPRGAARRSTRSAAS